MYVQLLHTILGFVGNAFNEMDSIFNRTKNALVESMGIITPIIEYAKDNH